MSESDLYSNYIRREPHERSKKFISNWHKKLLKHALSDIEDPVKNVLEIGPGHGYFATHVVDMGIDYKFRDADDSTALSRAVLAILVRLFNRSKIAQRRLKILVEHTSESNII